jgi:hypothetical protein
MTTLFHVTAVQNRASIRRHGLDWDRMGAAWGIANSPVTEVAGIFLARDRSEADWFAAFQDVVDVWAVTFDEDFNPHNPPLSLPFKTADTGYLYYEDRIPPSRVELVDADFRSKGPWGDE